MVWVIKLSEKLDTCSLDLQDSNITKVDNYSQSRAFFNWLQHSSAKLEACQLQTENTDR